MVAQSLSNFAPVSLGRVLIVGASTLTNFAFLQQIFKHDATGIPRLYTTIKAALAQCTASQGDVILVLPGHTENITNATDLNVNVAGVRIIGLGTGNLRPTLTLNTATTAIITFSAANCSMENIIVDGTGFASIVSMITVTAVGVTLRGNKFITNNATNQAGVCILTTAAADELTIDNNKFIGTTDAGMTNALQLIGADDCKITNNYFYGAYTTSLGPINNITTACLRILIENNVLINATASSTKVIVLVSGTTGMIRNNDMAILSGTAPITGAGTFVGGNYYVAAAGVGPSTLL